MLQGKTGRQKGCVDLALVDVSTWGNCTDGPLWRDALTCLTATSAVERQCMCLYAEVTQRATRV